MAGPSYHQERIQQLTQKVAHIQDEYFRAWAEVPTAKLVEMVQDIPPVPPRGLRPIIALQPIPPLAKKAEPITFQWASAEHAAKAAESTARYQARHVKAKR